MEEEFDSTDVNYKAKILKNMEAELEDLKKTHQNPEDLDEFKKLYEQFLDDQKSIQWSKIEPPKGKLFKYEECEVPENPSELLKKLVVLKLNGGLGTTMGCVGPKSAVKIKEGKNFIDMIVRQLSYLNRKYKCEVPLVLMNSFNTDSRTQKMIRNYDNIKTFNQSQFPRISAENMMPISGDEMYYPPGHGDLFYSLNKCGLLDELIAEGKEYLFVSNVDNLSSTVDLKILETFAKEELEFLMEVTNKTRADIKGGTLINYEDSLKLLEIAMVPSQKKSEFTSVRKFKIFNTNSVWINLKALKENINNIKLDIIENKKIVNDETVIQLETAIGSAIKCFKKTAGIVVPRSRFTPVKTCSDLFLCESNLYEEKHGELKVNPLRTVEAAPIIKLIGRNFDKIEHFENSFKGIPDIVDLDILTVTGNVRFGKNVVLKGIVIICAPEGCCIDIPDGSILDDKVLFGNLPITNV